MSREHEEFYGDIEQQSLCDVALNIDFRVFLKLILDNLNIMWYNILRNIYQIKIIE